MAKSKYRGKHRHREAHPKIFIWSHAEKAEIEYFQDYKNYLKTPLLMPRKEICWTPQELIQKVVKWKEKEVCDEDGDQVWCIFDVDDFYQDDKEGLLKSIKDANENNIKIAYANQCFELWILLHFEKPTFAIARGADIEKKIQYYFKNNKLGRFEKNRKVFQILLPFQPQAISNAKKLLTSYERTDWNKVLSENGNPSTSIHFLVEEICKLIGK